MKHSGMAHCKLRARPDGNLGWLNASVSGGRYESHYLRAVDPARPRGAWIRRTTHQRAGEAPTGALWCTVWDAEAGPPYAVKQSFPAPPAEGWRARAEAQGRSAAWELEPAGGEPALRHLPGAWMYRAPLPRTKLESPRPDAVFTGWIEAGGRRTEVAGWRGMVGHNWGSEHAERWVWLHAVGFEEAPGAWLDLALGRVRVGRAVTPWVGNGALALDGRRYRLGGLRHRVRVDARVAELEAVVAGAGVVVRIAVSAPAGQTVAFEYSDPGGGTHHALNCSIAEVRLRVERPGRPVLELATAHGGAYELGVRETGHGVPVEPFPDP
jgi:hypothetical protein